MRCIWFSRFVLAGLLLSGSAAFLFAQPVQWRAYTDGGWTACRDGNYKKALDLLEAGLKAAETFPPNDPRKALTNAYLAYASHKAGKAAESEQYAKQALAVYDKLQDADKDAPKGINALGLLRQSQRQFLAAEKFYKQAQSLEEKIQGGENHPAVAQLMANRGSLYELQGRYQEAEPLLKRAVAILGVDEKTDRGRLANTLLQLGGIYRAWGREKDAEPHLVRAVEIRRKVPGKNDLGLAHALSALGNLSFEMHRNKEAEPLLREALSIREKALKPLDPPQQLDLALSQHNLAVFCLEERKYTEAESLFQKALAIRQAAFPNPDARTAATLHNLGMLYLARKQYGSAESSLKEALAVKEKAEGPNNIDIAATAESLGNVYLGLGPKFNSQAETNFRRALTVREKALGPDSVAVAATQVVVANFYRDIKKFKEAEPLYQKALATREKQGMDRADVATVLEQYSALLKLTGNAAKADEFANRAKAIRAKTGTSSSS